MINSMVIPLTIKDYRKSVPLFWTYSMYDKAKMYDRCGLEIAEIENMFVANEICSILNHYEEVVMSLKGANEKLKDAGLDTTQIESTLKRCEEIYYNKDYYNDSHLLEEEVAE